MGGSRPKVSGDHITLAPGFRLGHFEIIERIGSGGMASVLKARDTELGRLVALKILPPESATDADSVTRFKQEARAAARLDHENIARVFFCGEDRGLHFIAFEFVEGDNLRTLIDRAGQLSPAECVRYMLQVSAGLAHAAERGVVHRDIKPSNLVVTPDGRAKIIDMGLARQHESSQSVNGGVTQSGVTLGTFDYISPEQALDPRRADVRSDIYSLGCAFYHALTGRPPVPPGTAAAKLQAQQHVAPIDPRLLNPAVPDELAVVLSRMMAKQPAHRYQTPHQLIADLQAVAQLLKIAGGDGVSGSSTVTPMFARVREPRGNLSLMAGLLAIVLAGVVLVAGTSGGGRSGPEELPWNESAGPGKFPSWQPDPASSSSTAGVSVPPRDSRIVETTEELLKVLQSPNPHAILRGGRTYDLSKTAGVLVANQSEVTLECPTPTDPPTIRISLAPWAFDSPGALRPETLTFSRLDQLHFRGLRFEIGQSGTTSETPDAPVGLLFADVARLDIRECRFEADPTSPIVDATALGLFRSARAIPAEAQFQFCFFHLRRWTGLDVLGSAKLNLQHCGLATSRSGFSVGSDSDDAGASNVQMELHQCSVLLENQAAVVEVAGASRCTLSASSSLFAAASAPEGTTMIMVPESRETRPSLVRNLSELADAFAFSTLNKEPNGFFRVPAPSTEGSLAIELKQSPWLHQPPIPRLNQTKEPWLGFQLNATQRALRDAVPAKIGILGVQFLPVAETRIYDQWPLARLGSDPLTTGVKIWWPQVPAAEKESLPKNVYDNLASALADLRPGDEIHIRGRGPIEIAGTPSFNKANRRVVIRAEAGSQPILVPAHSDRVDQALFRLEEGELRFEGIEFALRHPGDEAGDIRSTAVVAVAGGRRCEFHQCVFTLTEVKNEKATVLTVLDVSGQMRKPETIRPPDLVFDHCLLRGRGRAVLAPAAMPLRCQFTNSACALQGTVVELGTPGRNPPAGAAIELSLLQTTLVLGSSFVEVQASPNAEAGTTPGIPVEIRSEMSLFAPLDDEVAPLVLIRGEGNNSDSLVRWQLAGNGFANYAKTFPYMEVRSSAGASEKTWTEEDWLSFTREKPNAIGKAIWPRPFTTKSILHLQPDDGIPSSTEFGGVSRELGAKAAQLPKPASEDKEK